MDTCLMNMDCPAVGRLIEQPNKKAGLGRLFSVRFHHLTVQKSRT